MTVLIGAALLATAAASAPAAEACPVEDMTVPGHTGNLFPGVAVGLARHGFEVIARRWPGRPVMRRSVRRLGARPAGQES